MEEDEGQEATKAVWAWHENLKDLWQQDASL
jgi:hypothetical protein